MIVIIKEPDRPPRITDIEDEIEVFKEIIDCDAIQIVTAAYRCDIALILDDAGKLTGKMPNFWRYNDKICGTAIFAGIRGEDLASLTTEQMRFIESYLGSESIDQGELYVW